MTSTSNQDPWPSTELFDHNAIVIKVVACSQRYRPQEIYAVSVIDLTVLTLLVSNSVLTDDVIEVVPHVLRYNTDVTYVASKKNLVLVGENFNQELKSAVSNRDYRKAFYLMCLVSDSELGSADEFYGETALHYLACANHKYLFETALARMSIRGILKEAHASRGKGNVLHYLSALGNTDLVHALILIRPDLMHRVARGQGDHKQPLLCALFKGNYEIACLLFKYTDPEHAWGFVESPGTILIDAVREKSTRLVELLLGSKPQTEYEETVAKTLLRVRDGFLLENTDRIGHTALHAAVARGGDPVILDLVYKAYASAGLLLIKARDCGSTLLHCMIKEGDSNTVIKLIQRPDFDPKLLTMPDGRGSTPLHCAAAWYMYDVCKVLYPIYAETGCLLNQDNCGVSVLVSAIRGGNEHIVELLIGNRDQGVNNAITAGNRLLVTDDSNGCTPLAFAVRSGCADVFQVMYDQMDLEHICRPAGKQRRTILHEAIKAKKTNIIDLILKDQTKSQKLMSISDSRGRTALLYAKAKNPQVYEFLSQRCQSLNQ